MNGDAVRVAVPSRAIRGPGRVAPGCAGSAEVPRGAKMSANTLLPLGVPKARHAPNRRTNWPLSPLPVFLTTPPPDRCGGAEQGVKTYLMFWIFL